jgi:uncharacterized protein (TIGR02466 family)
MSFIENFKKRTQEIENFSEFTVHPLFPKVMGIVQVKEEMSFFEELKNLNFKNISEEHENTFISTDNKVLSKFKKEKEIFLSYFYKFKNSVLKLTDTDFDITTSWVTKTLKNGSSHPHSHKNSYYSGVFYFENISEGGGLNFQDNHLDTIWITPSSINRHNQSSFNVLPVKNRLIFFPSSLTHEISLYKGNQERYSLAFNIFPIGEFGDGDSSLNIKIN